MDEQRILEDFRKEQARQLERDAVILDAHAEQWDKMSKQFGRPDLMATAAERREEADAKRVSANKLHALTDIDPKTYAAQIAKVLRIQAQSILQQLIIVRERADHPDIYGGDPDTLRFDVESNEALVDALESRAVRLEESAQSGNLEDKPAAT
jgi:hypothetical protein